MLFILMLSYCYSYVGYRGDYITRLLTKFCQQCLEHRSLLTAGCQQVNQSSLIFHYCQLRTHGAADDPARRNRRHLCPHKESHHVGAKRLNRTTQVDTIEELVWRAVSESLRAPKVFTEQYNQRRESGYVTPGQQEQRPHKRRLV